VPKVHRHGPGVDDRQAGACNRRDARFVVAASHSFIVAIGDCAWASRTQRKEMMTATELIEQLNALDEHERIEAKRASEIGRSVMETICAFANEPGLKGGTLLLGVARDELALFPAYEIVGIDQPDTLSQVLATRCRTEFNVPVRVDIAVESVGGRAVLVVGVPEAQPGDKPVYFRSKGLPRGAFRRIGSTDQECTDEDLLTLYQGRHVESFDASVMPDAGVDDLDADAIHDYRRAIAAGTPSAEALRWTDEELLLALGAVRRMAAQPTSPLQPTIAGIVLFGKAAALRRLLPLTRIEYIRVPGKEWVSDPERRYDTVEIRDPLLRAIRRALAAVLDDLPKSFNLPAGEVQRRDIPTLPVNVVREAIVNAVMHRSYRAQGAVQVIRYANRLEIRNPGFSLKPVEHLGEPGSQARNPRIAAVLYETGLAEVKGTGVGAMRRLMEEAGLEPPLFSSDRGADQFVATYYFQHFLSEEALAWLAQFKDVKLNSEEARALLALREQGAIDNAMYRAINRVDTLTASQSLRRLRDAGLLQQRERGSATYYVPGQRLVSLQGVPANPTTLPPNLDSLPPKFGGLSRKLDGVPETLRARVASLGRRSLPAELEQAIEALCRWRELGADEIAAIVARRRDTIRDYLARMVRDGRLTLKFPDQPNHPHQAYRASRVRE
jgi:ATP-dependent DNA helicase RecG